MAKQMEEGGAGVSERSSRRKTEGRSESAGSGKPKPDGKAAGRPRKSSAASGEDASPRARPRTRQPDLRKDLRDFASARPEGWDHDDWLNFLESLKERGHDIADREAIGMALERERLDLALARVKGVGPQKRQALIERYGNLWKLRHADVEEIASTAGVSSSVAEKIRTELR